MLRIKNRSDYECPDVKHTMWANAYQPTIADEPVSKLLFHTEEQNRTVATLSGSSQVEYYLSQDNNMMADTFDSNLVTQNHYYKEALIVFEEMINSCNTKVQFNELLHVINQHMTHISSKGVNAPMQQSTGAVLFGEGNTNQKLVKSTNFCMKYLLMLSFSLNL